MNIFLVRQRLNDILNLKCDTDFELLLEAFVEENFQSGNPLENYGTVDELRNLLDSFGVESEDIIVAYKKEIKEQKK